MARRGALDQGRRPRRTRPRRSSDRRGGADLGPTAPEAWAALGVNATASATNPRRRLPADSQPKLTVDQAALIQAIPPDGVSSVVKRPVSSDRPCDAAASRDGRRSSYRSSLARLRSLHAHAPPPPPEPITVLDLFRAAAASLRVFTSSARRAEDDGPVFHSVAAVEHDALRLPRMP